jgi:hypothetical protein
MKPQKRTLIPTNSTHEDFSRDDDAVRGSDRSFGFVMASGLATLSTLNSWHGGRVWPYMLSLAALFALAALLFPVFLSALNKSLVQAWLITSFADRSDHYGSGV